MSLFPDCSFELRLPKKRQRPGDRVSAELTLNAPSPIERAKELRVVYVVRAWAGYGSGKNRTIHTEVLFRDAWKFALRRGLGDGLTRFPFELAVPRGAPPSFRGEDCAIEHEISATLDVDWARDPSWKKPLVVVQRPRKGPVTPMHSRTGPDFHEQVVLEISLESSIIPEDGTLRGQIALRGGADQRFDRATLSLCRESTIVMARKDKRVGAGLTAEIAADALRTGDPQPFEFPPRACGARFKSGFIDVETQLRLRLEVPWERDPIATVPVKIMPVGSRLYGEGDTPVVGSARVRHLAAQVARHLGVDLGSGPEIVRTRVGGVGVSLFDATRDAHAGVDMRLDLPSLELATSLRPIGALDALRGRDLAPPFLSDHYALRSRPERHVPRYDDAMVAAFYGSVLSPLAGGEDFRFTDRNLSAFFRLGDDEVASVKRIASRAMTTATAISDAIASLPFPEPCRAHEEVWRAFALEDPSRALVPMGPSIHGLVLGRRVSNGDQRVLRAALRTIWSERGPHTRAEVTFDDPLDPNADRLGDFFEGASSPRVDAVRAVFPRVSVDASGATLDAPSFLGDPRDAIAGLERFLEWTLDARGERVADAPYR